MTTRGAANVTRDAEERNSNRQGRHALGRASTASPLRGEQADERGRRLGAGGPGVHGQPLDRGPGRSEDHEDQAARAPLALLDGRHPPRVVGPDDWNGATLRRLREAAGLTTTEV